MVFEQARSGPGRRDDEDRFARENNEHTPPSPPTHRRALRVGDNGPPSHLFARHFRSAQVAPHPSAPLGFPTARAAQAYADANSAGPPHLHWTIVWDRRLHEVEGRLQTYDTLLELGSP